MSVAEPWSLCLAPLPVEEFFRDILHTRPWHVRRDEPERFAGILDLREIDRLLSSGLVAPPLVDVWKKGKKVPADQLSHPRRFNGVTNEHACDVRRVYDELHAGSVVTLRQIQDYVPRVQEICDRLQADVGHVVESHAVVALRRDANVPAPARSNSHDLLVLQVMGRQIWRVQGCPPSASGESTYSEYPLSAGDTLYVPRGCAHEERLDGELSLHVTLSLGWMTLHEALRAVVGAALTRLAELPEFQRPLVPRPDATDAASEQARLLEHGVGRLFEAVRRLDATEALESFTLPKLRVSRPSLVDLAALNELDLDRWCERTSLSPTIERAPDGSIEVRARGEALPLPPWLVDEAHVLLAQKAPFRAATLAYACSPQEFLLLVKSFVLLKLLRVTGEP